MVDAKQLLADLKRLRRTLEADLREQHQASAQRDAAQAEWREALKAKRTADTLESFWTAALDQAAVYWILGVFLRFLKDNRLLPRGWKREGPGPALTGRFLEATQPDAKTAQDAQYADGSGTDEVLYRMALPAGVDASRVRVRATLYYQAIPPYFLRNLFETAPDGPATQRLHHIAHNLNLDGRPIENWKLRIASAESQVSTHP